MAYDKSKDEVKHEAVAEIQPDWNKNPQQFVAKVVSYDGAEPKILLCRRYVDPKSDTQAETNNIGRIPAEHASAIAEAIAKAAQFCMNVEV